ncbi:MAG: hypothetical protein ABIT96_02070 [Ferruginibacter sp.]
MKFLLALILTAGLSYALCLYFPWWTIALAAFATALLVRQRAGLSFLSAFAGIFILWALLSFFITNANENILANKVSILLFNVNPILLILMTAITGAIISGLSALSAALLFQPRAI